MPESGVHVTEMIVYSFSAFQPLATIPAVISSSPHMCCHCQVTNLVLLMLYILNTASVARFMIC